MDLPGDIATRLRRALTAALKAGDTSTVSALRSALSAIANAEAVAVRQAACAMMLYRSAGLIRLGYCRPASRSSPA